MTFKWIPLACLLASMAARAELGAAPTTGATPVATGAAWQQWQLQRPDGVRIDEYTAANGQVFAVTWQGPVKPDLESLLGPRFQAYLNKAGKPRGPSASRVASQDLVVSSGGHMGAFQGAAWIPSRLPAGFEPERAR